jgi:hypothetical protein
MPPSSTPLGSPVTRPGGKTGVSTPDARRPTPDARLTDRLRHRDDRPQLRDLIFEWYQIAYHFDWYQIAYHSKNHPRRTLDPAIRRSGDRPN